MKNSILIITLLFSSIALPAIAQNTGATRDAINQLKKGERALDAGNSKEAITRFIKATELDATVVAAWEKLASIYYSEGKFGDVISSCENGLKANPGTSELQMWLGLSQQFTGKVKEGTGNLEKAVRGKSSLALAYFEPARKIGLGVYYRKTSEWQKALNAFSNFLKYRPKEISKDVDHLVYFRLGELNLKTGKSEEALKNCDKALKINNRYPSAQWCKAEALRGLKRYTEALPYFRRVAPNGGKNPRIFIGLAVSLFYSGSATQALNYARRYLGLRPADYEGQILVGDLYYAMGKRQDAVRSWQRAMKLNPNEMKIYIKTGIAFIKMKQVFKAVETLEVAYKKWPNSEDIIIPLAHALVMEKKAKQAWNILEKLNNQAMSPRLKTIYGIAAVETNRFDEARKVLADVVKTRPDSIQAREYAVKNLIKIGWREINAGKLIETFNILSEARKLQPTNMDILRNMALVAMMKNDITESEKLIAEGLKALPDDYHFNRLLGRLRLDQGKIDEAVKILVATREKARSRSSDIQARIEMDLGVAYILKGDFEKAVDVLKESYSNSLNEPDLAAQIEKNLVRAILARANMRLGLGKGKDALTDLESLDEYKAKLTKTEQRQKDFLIALAYVDLGNYKDGTRYMNKVQAGGSIADLFKAPWDKFGQDLINAYLAYRQGRYDTAKVNFYKTWKNAPQDIRIQIGNFIRSCDEIAASTMLRSGKASKALEYFKNIPDQGMSPASRLNKALALYQSGQVDAALIIWKALGTPMAACNLAAHYHNTNNSAESFKYYKICTAAGLGGESAKTLMNIKSKIFGYK
ncbi:tetratricopeptide repeat protein [Myxococcota bacterium]|nr:tetratricopeptide repeat protein [Myxococcota bacterium]MBU1381133.1 tetratricopeptide repeat protein [Myxococcota bacterium]MBU1496705.1 tetratricopeptide repeat protein [Myxococcota bacterium]